VATFNYVDTKRKCGNSDR